MVMYSSEKPAKDVYIYTNLMRFGVSAFTDSAGKFYLENVRFNDTIYVSTPNFLKKIFNHGSRTLRISIPPADQPRHISTTVKIEATALSKKEVSISSMKDDCAGSFAASLIYRQSIQAGIKN